jgi:hypothetical protein
MGGKNKEFQFSEKENFKEKKGGLHSGNLPVTPYYQYKTVPVSYLGKLIIRTFETLKT